jgi:hypothetical protein
MVEGVLALSEQSLSLVAAYEARKILPAKYEADLRHIALATIDEVASLVSWNFKHIVRLENSPVQRGQRRIGIQAPQHPVAEGSDNV